MAREINKLNPMKIKAAPIGKLSDGGGLYLDKTATSAKWIWRYVISGQKREMGLGSVDDVTLAGARRARDKWADVLREGRDPISERNRLAEAEKAERNRANPTFAEAAADAFEARKASLRGDGERGRWFSPIRVHLVPKVGKRRISELHQRDIKDALATLWHKHPQTAEKAIQRLSIIFRHARLSGYACHEETVEHARHMLGGHTIDPVGITSTPWQDVPTVFAALRKPGVAAMALRWVMLTATRSDSARGARFTEIDGAVWTVPADRMKGREGKAQPFRVPLSTAALALLDECRAIAIDDRLFPGYRRDVSVSQNALLHVLNDIGEAGRPHGFRTSFRSWVQDTNAASYDVAEAALAHLVGNRVERSYARSDMLDQRAALMQRWSDHVTGVAAKVVPLRA